MALTAGSFFIGFQIGACKETSSANHILDLIQKEYVSNLINYDSEIRMEIEKDHGVLLLAAAGIIVE